MSLAGGHLKTEPWKVGGALRDALAIAMDRAPTDAETKAVARAIIRSVSPGWITGAPIDAKHAPIVGERYDAILEALREYGRTGCWSPHALWSQVIAELTPLMPPTFRAVVEHASRRSRIGRPVGSVR